MANEPNLAMNDTLGGGDSESLIKQLVQNYRFSRTLDGYDFGVKKRFLGEMLNDISLKYSPLDELRELLLQLQKDKLEEINSNYITQLQNLAYMTITLVTKKDNPKTGEKYKLNEAVAQFNVMVSGFVKKISFISKIGKFDYTLKELVPLYKVDLEDKKAFLYKLFHGEVKELKMNSGSFHPYRFHVYILEQLNQLSQTDLGYSVLTEEERKIKLFNEIAERYSSLGIHWDISISDTIYLMENGENYFLDFLFFLARHHNLWVSSGTGKPPRS